MSGACVALQEVYDNEVLPLVARNPATPAGRLSVAGKMLCACEEFVLIYSVSVELEPLFISEL